MPRVPKKAKKAATTRKKAAKKKKVAKKRTKRARKKLLTTSEAQKALGIKDTAFRARLKNGMPVAGRRGRTHLFDLEQIQQWAKRRGIGGGVGRPSRKKALAGGAEMTALEKEGLAQKQLKTQKLQLQLDLELGMGKLGLGETIRASKTSEDLVNVSREALALFVEGKLPESKARQFKALLSEQRLALILNAQNITGGQRQILVTDAGWRIARVFEGIVDDGLRMEALKFMVKLAKQDLELTPNKDHGG